MPRRAVRLRRSALTWAPDATTAAAAPSTRIELLPQVCTPSRYSARNLTSTSTGQFNRLRQPFSLGRAVLRHAGLLAVIGAQHTASEHQIGHTSHADESGNTYRTTAADEQASLAFRQGVNRETSFWRMAVILNLLLNIMIFT